MKTIPSQLIPLRRTMWKPRVQDGDGTPYNSKFSGTPWLSPNEAWPRCRHCDEPMPLFLQLNLDALPDELSGGFGSGLLQFFYCTNTDPHCESECEAFWPFSESQLVRVVQPEGESLSVELPEVALEFPPTQIIGWEPDDDYPNWEESAEYGVELSDDEWERLSEQGYPRSGDKLAGWPLWIQGIEYPHCPVCHQRMGFVFQIDSNDHVPHQFGDLGCGHLTQCPTHHTQVAFGWACG